MVMDALSRIIEVPFCPGDGGIEMEEIQSVLSGALVTIMIVAAILTAPTALFLLWLYRRAVIRFMGKRARPAREERATPETPAVPPPPPSTKLEFAFLENRATPKGKPGGLLARLRLFPWQAATIYVLGGVFYAAVIAAAWLSAAGETFTLIQFIFIFWIALWPVVPIINQVASLERRSGAIVVTVYFLALTILFAVTLALNPDVEWQQMPALWAIFNLPATALVSAFLYRRVRAVGPIVYTFTLFAISGFVLIGIYGGSALADEAVQNEGLARSIMNRLAELGFSGNIVAAIFFVTGMLIMAAVGWFALLLLKRLYIHKKVSDLSLVLDPIWIVFAFWHSVELVFVNPWWILAAPIAFLVYKIITAVGIALWCRKRRERKGPHLLHLRVFSLGQRSERLFNSIAKAWRYTGSIHIISGPDLATVTVEPNEFMDYLTGRLERKFIDDPEAIAERIAQMDTLPDRDGRYRINDFFCHADTWKTVLLHLAGISNAVLMDLRQFSAQRAGCTYEIASLIDHVSLERVLFIIDSTTDEPFFLQALETSWMHMPADSPNRKTAIPRVRIFRYTGKRRGEFRRLLHALAAETAPVS
jgi:hypothetical protein